MYKLKRFFSGPTPYADKLALYRFHNGKTFIWIEDNSSRFYISTYNYGEKYPLCLYLCKPYLMNEKELIDHKFIGSANAFVSLDKMILVAANTNGEQFTAALDFIAGYKTIMRGWNGCTRRKALFFDKESKLRESYVVNCSGKEEPVILRFDNNGKRIPTSGGLLI